MFDEEVFEGDRYCVEAFTNTDRLYVMLYRNYAREVYNKRLNNFAEVLVAEMEELNVYRITDQLQQSTITPEDSSQDSGHCSADMAVS